MPSRHVSHVEYARFGDVEDEKKGTVKKLMAFLASGAVFLALIKVSLVSLLP